MQKDAVRENLAVDPTTSSLTHLNVKSQSLWPRQCLFMAFISLDSLDCVMMCRSLGDVEIQLTAPLSRSLGRAVKHLFTI